MTQKYQVKVSMKQAAIVETGIVLKQGDFGMQIEIEVLDFDATGTTPQIVFRKAMGAVESTTITVSGNKYTYTFKGTELDTPGKVFCDLKLKNSTTQRISTASFMFKVVADTMNGLTEESNSYSDTIAQIVGSFDDDFENVNDRISEIGSDNTKYYLKEKKVSGTAAWNGEYITLPFTPVAGKKYYLHIDDVENCMTSVCATIRGRQGSTTLTLADLTVNNVENDESVYITCPDNADSIMVILYRNNSAETTAQGTTTFSKVTVKEGSADSIFTIGEEVDLTKNEDFIGLNDKIDADIAEVETELNEKLEVVSEIGKDNIKYYLREQEVSGTAAWNGEYITLPFTPVAGKKYYLHIDDVENCLTSVCATIRARQGSSTVTFADLTVSNVENDESAFITFPDSADSLMVVLYRNNSASTTAQGTTTFSKVTVKEGSADSIFTIGENVDLTKNEDFIALNDKIDADIEEVEAETNEKFEEIAKYIDFTLVEKIASKGVSGTGPWEAYSLTLDEAIPATDTKYYLRIGSVTNCMTSQCARIQLLNNTTPYTEATLTTSDVENGLSCYVMGNSSVANKVKVTLYRNASSSTVEAGTTTFENVTVTKIIDDDIGILNGDVRLSDPEITLDETLAKIDKIGFSKEVETIDTTNNGFMEQTIDWITSNYCLYFDRDVYINTINPSFTESGKTVTYYIGKTNTETIQNDATLTTIDTISGVTGTPVILNRILHKNELIRISCPQAYIKVAEIRYNKGCFLYAPKICYANAGTTIRNVGDEEGQWGNMRSIGVFNVYETTDFINKYNNYWFGKKIVWFGTSIPEGGYAGDKRTSYPVIVGEKLGAAVFNEAVGSSSISRTHPSFISETNPYGYDTRDFEFAARCLGDSLTLKQWLIDNYDAGYFNLYVPASMTDSLKDRIKGYSYEKKVDRYLDGGEVGDVDLYVFDQGYNDDFTGGYRDVEALEEQYGIDTDYCFDGGMNFLLRRILKANPDAKIIIISHFTINAPCASQINTDHVEAVCKAQKDVADRWGIKFVNIYEKLGWSGQIITTTGYWDATTNVWINSGGTEQNITVKNMHVRDRTHPFTDASGKSNRRVADVIAAEIKNIIR